MGSLTVYEKIDNPIAFVEAMAESNAAMIPGCDLKAGRALSMMLLRRGMDAMDFIQRYHFIQGKPTMRADAMLAEFRLNKGGKHRIIQRTPDVSEAEFTDADGNVYVMKLTWPEVLQERYPWAKGCGPGTKNTEPTFENLKDNWATPQGRKQMMWARLTSDSLRAIVPELVAGIYTPEEAIDFEENQPKTAEVPKQTASQIVAAAAVVPEAPEPPVDEAPTGPAPVDMADGNVEEAEFETKSALAEGPGTATADQIALITKLGEEKFESAWITKRDDALKARNCSVLQNLSCIQATELIGKLEQMVREKRELEKN